MDTNIKVGYILSIIHRNDRKAYHINIIYIFHVSHFQDKCPFLLGTDENSIVFNGIIAVYSITINVRYPPNMYGINSGVFSIFMILNIGMHNITNNAICDSNLFGNVLDHIKYSISCIIMNDW
jgi:hypothetical protein